VRNWSVDGTSITAVKSKEKRLSSWLYQKGHKIWIGRLRGQNDNKMKTNCSRD
jgi:hypothetical protein